VKGCVFEGEGADLIVRSTLIARNMDSDSQVQFVSWGSIVLTTASLTLFGWVGNGWLSSGYGH
jgi:hypothetical protein